VNDLMKTAVGMIGISIADFFISEVRDIILIIEGYTLKRKQDFEYQQLAVTNAIGIFLGGKSFKPSNPFEKEKKKVNKISKKEKESTKDYLMDRFKSNGVMYK